jgi:sigma-B regulation protein RsbU (phosphoserine phosphatase)
LLELKDKLLARDELEAGRRVQRALTPERNPNFEGWQIYIFTQSANEVGGDLVDFLLTDPKRALIALADISGKGLQAALMMAKLQAMIRALASYVQPLDNLVSHINFIFHRDSLPSTFASLLYVDISSESGELNYVNAGHFPPLLLQNNEIRELAKGELAIGLQSNSQYTLNTIQLNSGDLFIGYSDGIIESKNEAGEFYGVDRFFPVLKSSVGLTAEQLGERVILNVKQFVHNAQANDDMSLIIIKKI